MKYIKLALEAAFAIISAVFWLILASLFVASLTFGSIVVIYYIGLLFQ